MRFHDSLDLAVPDPDYEKKARKSNDCVKYQTETQWDKFVRFSMYANPDDNFHEFDILSEFGQSKALKCFGFCKQGLYGDVTLEAPSYFEIKSRLKWNAWKALEGTSKDSA